MTSRQVSQLQDELRDFLGRAERWAEDLCAASELAGTSLPGGPENVQTISALRTRAASTLLKVGLFGAFSSGKTYLLCGLQGTLRFTEVKRGNDRPQPRYIGLLPFSPNPTTACPVQITPVADGGEVDASGTGFMRVRFVGDEEWEDVGNSVGPSVTAAYVRYGADPSNRRPQHVDRVHEVAEAEILMADFRIPATLWDLPGYGSPVKAHDAIVKAAMNDADCFLYVSRGKTLDDKDRN